ncbi:M20 family metallopeptidase [Paenibacillus doosanensis]|uniref:p-aminobenzoyl-glutamate hydrolase subunit B n=1 Tax=Paenibacillus konkukensis TaxID=2020716 RepID=A0ABY4RSP0_9BACL|nr:MULTISPECIES: M20 family metallopeptidase [Paenibacillus]MCS7462080.1 M20 family metallopeptidase [Paenibacillus doosanensis]UQZ85148.1 p-aminobenzoyl-glutamate hydrolase subunit B [Paenibacillus konkukensis]
MDNKRSISEIMEGKREMFIQVSDRIWEFAETRFEEFRSAELLCATLENEGFKVERGVGGMETAFVGSYGSGGPVVAILGEYDALAGLSQYQGEAQEHPVVPGGNGHGCGHNLLGTGSLAAAVSLRHYMEENGIAGTVRYYGCPGEEGGSGKAFMAKAGLFDDADIAICWHPGVANGIMSGSSLANYQVYYKFKGRTSHAAASPHLGRSALDAVELMNVGVNYLREHIIQEARVHYAITNSGGISPNVVQGEAEVLYLIRAPKTQQVEEIYQRICNIARGAALMTGTEAEIVFDKACSNVVPNSVLENVMHECFQELGVPQFTEEELRYAGAIRSSLSDADKSFSIRSELKDKDMCDVLLPLTEEARQRVMSGSTDVGDVSWVVPTVQCSTACWAIGTPAHTWQVVSQGATSISHKAMLHAGKVMAETALKVLLDPDIAARAKAELSELLDGQAYVSPIPDGVKPSAKK